MAVAIHNIKRLIGQYEAMSNRRVELKKTIDFSVFDPDGLVNDDDAAFMNLPEGFVFEGALVILRSAEGSAATINIGTEAAETGFAVEASLNGVVDAPADRGSATIAAETYFEDQTEVRITAVAGNPKAAIIDVIIFGMLVS